MSDKAKHTPGKWTIERHDRHASGPRFVICAPDHANRVAVLSTSGAPHGDESIARANAALISAAPDLYTALKEIVEHPAAFSDGAKHLWSQALAAVAKAERRAE